MQSLFADVNHKSLLKSKLHSKAVHFLDRFLIRLDNSKAKYQPNDGMTLLREMRSAIDEYGCVVKNLRVTNKAIEFDLYAPNENAKVKSISVLESKFGRKHSERNLTKDEPLLDKNKTVEDSIRLFNEQRYWECHETMEQIWRKEPIGPEKDVQQGFILAASALVHYQKNENEVCLNMIPRTLQKLNHWHEAKYLSLDVAGLKSNLNKIYETREIMPFTI
jgi:hypothetical protein